MISGGGTGGHVYPAIAIAHALRARHADTEILFVGAKGRMEMEKVPEAGYEIEGLWISGIQRRLTLDNLSFPLKVMSSIMKSRGILSRFQPDAVVGVGGYASGPLLYAATGRKIPALVQEQNSFAGLTNKLLGPKVQTVCVAHKGMDKFFAPEKIVFTGNPVRKDIRISEEKRAEGMKAFGLDPDKKTVLVLGGSLGARTLNEGILAGAEKLKGHDVQVLWQTGKFYIEEMEQRLPEAMRSHIHPRQFIREMDLAYAVADVVVSRAGALSISEIALTGRPTVFVPSPNVAEDHQTKNAQSLVEEGAAAMVRDGEAVKNLADEAIALLNDAKRQETFSQNLKKLAMPDADERIADEVLKLADRYRNR
ncbi:undecaprenyldiphospho-muramoylpentapeptide beta-N-acetylglucosaminyltransferase [Roseivirga sp. BDSF3-8]|uniref:undecaprenyldiphospho-muramoylpentapeptide beta-N-acetylglucosaminyltransferase n=1 Tax=Roseivirga sp. BDSF3-8 TaxID=3241598 RepID=UPI003531E8AF